MKLKANKFNAYLNMECGKIVYLVEEYDGLSLRDLAEKVIDKIGFNEKIILMLMNQNNLDNLLNK